MNKELVSEKYIAIITILVIIVNMKMGFIETFKENFST